MNLVFVISMTLIFSACRSADFSGESGRTKEPAIANPTPSDPPLSDPDPSVPDEPSPPGIFGLGKIQDRSVNTGDRSNSYSEDLVIKLKPGGGSPPYKITVKTTPAAPQMKVGENHELTWRPGYTDSSGYHSQEGTYSVVATAEDALGKTASSSFKVKVVLLSWKSLVVSTSNYDDMVVDFSINEYLHANRVYVHIPRVLNQNLNSKTCKNMGNPTQTIQLSAVPTVTSLGSSPISSGGTEHKLRLFMSYPLASQPLTEMMFVTRLNFMAQDDGKNVQKEETGVFVTYAYARCKNPLLSESECKQFILKSGGKAAMYYCSDFIGRGSLDQTMNASYCGIAKLNGVNPSGC